MIFLYNDIRRFYTIFEDDYEITAQFSHSPYKCKKEV